VGKEAQAHSRNVKVGKYTLEYTATAASIIVMDREENPAGHIFYTACRLDEKIESSRPVTFDFNGGPGGHFRLSSLRETSSFYDVVRIGTNLFSETHSPL
jgi:carboxypeptidase C (cathepsin A)